MSQECRLEYKIQHKHTHMLTLLQMYGITPAHSVFVWPFAGVLKRRGIDKPTNSNWAITTLCDGIDSTVLGAGR